MKKLIPAMLLVLAFNANAKLLDKIAGVINDKVYSLSELKRIQSTVKARKEIAPFIYTKKKYSVNDILKLQHRIFIVKDFSLVVGGQLCFYLCIVPNFF